MRRLAAFALLSAACAHDPIADRPPGPPPCPYEWAHDGTQSYVILCREPLTNRAKVKHVLIGWTGLATARSERTYADAQALARSLLEKLSAGERIEPLMKQYSDDPGSADTGMAYEATPSASLVSEFKSLSMRLNVNEAGIVKSSYGLHVIERVE